MTRSKPSKTVAQILWALVVVLVVVLAFRWPEKPTSYSTSSATISAHS